MILHLINGEKVEITRMTCGHYTAGQYNEPSCSWNINPIGLVHDREKGFFAIGKWGCDGYHDNNNGMYIRTPENFEQLIPIRNVVTISDIGKW